MEPRSDALEQVSGPRDVRAIMTDHYQRVLAKGCLSAYHLGLKASDLVLD